MDSGVELTSCYLNDINQHLLCALCSGYLINATAVIECLHTFCRSCIVRYLESSQTCPVCDVPLHENNPLLGIKADHTLQRLVYKLVPDVYKGYRGEEFQSDLLGELLQFKDEEVERRFAFYQSQTCGGQIISKELLLKDVEDTTFGRKIYAGGEMFSICLRYFPGSNMSKDSSDNVQMKIETRFLLCPASLSIGLLKKLISNKLDLSTCINEGYQLDILHGNELLDDDYTLVDVAYITEWAGTIPLHLDYTIRSGKAITIVTTRGSSAITCNRLNSSHLCVRRTSSTVSKNRSVKSKQPVVTQCIKRVGNRLKKAEHKKLTSANSKHAAAHNENLTSVQFTTKQVKAKKYNRLPTSETDPKCASGSMHSEENTDENVLELVASCNHRLRSNEPGANSQKLSTDVEFHHKLNSNRTDTVAVRKTPVVLKQCVSKQELNWQKSILSKICLSKTSKQGEVCIGDMNVSKVNAVKYLLLPKLNLCKDRTPLIGFMRKHRKWQRRQGKILSLASQVEKNEIVDRARVVMSNIEDVETIDSATVFIGSTENTEIINTEMKDVVSSSNNLDSLTTNNENVVSSSTSSSQYEYDEYDYVTSDDGRCAKSEQASECKTRDNDIDLDRKTLCVPIRLGEHGELLLRLPQNVSVECSFRPVAMTHVSQELESNCHVNESCKKLADKLPEPSCSSVGLSKSSCRVDENCLLSEVGAKPIAISSGTICSSMPLETESQSTCRQLSSDNDSTWSNEQPDINLFPFVTVSPSRRKVALSSCITGPCSADVSNSGCNSGWTSPIPTVSSSLGSPVARSTPDRSTSTDSLSSSSVVQMSFCQATSVPSSCVAKALSDGQLSGVAQREIIKVPVYTAVLRDYKSAKVPSGDLHNLTLSQIVEQRKANKLIKRPLKKPSPNFPVHSDNRHCSTVKKSAINSPVHTDSSHCSTLYPTADKTVQSLCTVNLQRCDADTGVWQQQLTATNLIPPTTKRLKLMCNGITIYRNLDDDTARVSKHRSSRSESFERPLLAGCRTKHRQRSLPEEYSIMQPAAMSTVLINTNETNKSTSKDVKILSHETKSSNNLNPDEPLELTTPMVRERYKINEYECCTGALDLTVTCSVSSAGQ